MGASVSISARETLSPILSLRLTATVAAVAVVEETMPVILTLAAAEEVAAPTKDAVATVATAATAATAAAAADRRNGKGA